MIKKINHISIAVHDLDQEIKKYRDILGLEFHGTEVVADQQVTIAFFKVGDACIELTMPTDPGSPVAKFLKKRGSGIHHIAYEVDDLCAQIKEFEEQGVRMVDNEPRIGAGGAKIAFVHPKSFSGVLIELIEKKAP